MIIHVCIIRPQDKFIKTFFFFWLQENKLNCLAFVTAKRSSSTFSEELDEKILKLQLQTFHIHQMTMFVFLAAINVSRKIYSSHFYISVYAQVQYNAINGHLFPFR